MSDDLPPIDETLRALVAAERDAGTTAAPGKARVKARLDALIAPVPGGGGGGGGGAGAAPTSALGRLAAVFAAGALVGGAVVYAALPPQIVERVVQVERSALPATATATGIASSPIVQRAAVAPQAEDASAPVAPVVSARPAADSLAAERALLDPARTALGRGDGASALDAVRKHELAFRSGALAEEREAIAVQALVQLKRREEAAARGERFLVRYPGSVLAPAVRAALEAGQ